jgi:hypothetical protein
MDPFASPNGQPDGDPFAAPAPVGDFPDLLALRGRLLMIQPTKLETGLVSAQFSEPGKPHIYDRLTATVHVVDGGQVRAADGTAFEGSSFPDMYLSQTRILSQCKTAVGHHMVLGRLDTFKPGAEPKKGNPWGLSDPTDAEKQAAREFIANGYRQAQQQPAPVQQVPAPQGWGAPPVQAQQPAAPQGWAPPAAQTVPPQQGGWGQPVQPTGNPFG